MNWRVSWERFASYSYARVRSGWSRVRGALVPNLQAAVCATLAWSVCHYLLGDPYPIFAPIAAFICLGFTRNRQPFKVFEMGLGATFGVFFGGVFGHFFGFGIWQLLVLMIVTPMVARFMSRSEFMTFQTGINSIIVASSSMLSLSMSETTLLSRWTNALVGAGIALLATIVIPTNVVSRPQRYVAFMLVEVADLLRRTSRCLLAGDAKGLGQISGRLYALRETLSDTNKALGSARDTAQLSPTARRSRATLDELSRMSELIGRMHISLLMMHRQARNMIAETGAMPELAQPLWQIADLLDEIARGIQRWSRPTHARDSAVRLASHLSPGQIADPADWRSTVLVSVTRSLIVDLLQLTGLSQAQARLTLSDIGHYSPVEAESGVDGPSPLWGTEHLPAIDDEDDRG